MENSTHYIVTKINFCWRDENFLGFMSGISAPIILLPFLMPFLTILWVYKFRNKYFLITSVLSYAKLICSWVLQDVFLSERPHKECVPFFMSKYGLPLPEIVFFVTGSTAIIFFKLTRKKRSQIYIFKTVFTYLWSNLVYCSCVYLSVLGTLNQVVITASVSVVISLTMSYLIKETLTINLSKRFKKAINIGRSVEV